jgi:hypothetical protein
VGTLHLRETIYQAPRISSQAHVEVFEMPGCDDDFHECSTGDDGASVDMAV